MGAATPSLAIGLRCQRCSGEFRADRRWEGCPACADDAWAANVVVDYDLKRAKRAWRQWSGRGLWRYAAFLPADDPAARVSLGEGATPLLRLSTTVRGWRRVWLKNESTNPTWSYKDRQCAVAVAKALEFGTTVVTAWSTGNHGASAAAYAARVGLVAVISTREDTDPKTVASMQVYGATVIRTTRRGRWSLLAHGVRERDWYPASTYTPAPTGNPTAPRATRPSRSRSSSNSAKCRLSDWLPSVYGEGLSGIWAGFQQLAAIGVIDGLPRMIAAEPAGGGPLAHALDPNLERVCRTPLLQDPRSRNRQHHRHRPVHCALRDSGGNRGGRLRRGHAARSGHAFPQRDPSRAAGLAGLVALEYLAARWPELDPTGIPRSSSAQPADCARSTSLPRTRRRSRP